MVGNRRAATRGNSQNKSTTPMTIQTRKRNVADSSSGNKRRAVQEPAERVEATSKKRARKVLSQLSYIPSEDDPNRDIRLLNLPGEIFEAITSWLEPHILTSLSLTCKAILSLVGRGPGEICRNKRQHLDETGSAWTNYRQHLIDLLARDAPHHLKFCDVCMTLHPPLKPPREHRETNLTKRCFGQWCTINYLPRGDCGGYSLLWEHIFEARKSLAPGNDGSPIELLDGNFTAHHPEFSFTLISSGSQIEKNLVLRHEHIFRARDARSPLRLADIVALPIRICPHQTTTMERAGENRHAKSRLPSGLLCHSIAAAAPSALRGGLPTADKFCAPASSEQKQIDSAAAGGFWTCRACPTKWRVRYSSTAGGEVKITAWHSLGDTPYRAQEYWKMLVRRETPGLGAQKRNSEFFFTTRQYLDFEVGEDI